MTEKGRAGHVKGVTFISAKHFAERYGADRWARVIAAMPEEHRRTAEEALPIGWYAHEVYTALLYAFDRELGDGRLSIMTDMGRFQAEHDLNVFFRVVLRFWSPAILVEKIAQMWGRYHDTGTWNVVRRGDHGITASLTDWQAASDALCANIVAYTTRLFELVGAKRARVEHTQCAARGGSCCVWTVDWA